MLEFLYLCFQPANLPFTVLLILVFAYWITVVTGVVGMDALDFDLGPELDVDADVDAAAGNGGSALGGILRFFHVGDVPLMIVFSFFVGSMWVTSLVGNFYIPKWFNVEPGMLVAVVMFVPNVILSLLVVKVLTTPLSVLFRKFNAGLEPRTQIVGKTCVITTSEVTRKFGQADLYVDDGPAVRLNVRADPKEQLGKGDVALVVSHSPQGDTYDVVAYDPGLDADLE